MKNSSTEIIIIGAGISGLAAGCYAQMNRYRTQIFEMHNLPGGLCTAWKRNGYVFDGCIHYLFGSGVLVENDKAIGVRLYDNKSYKGDRIISACDGRGTLFDLLQSQYVTEEMEMLYDGYFPAHSQLQVSLGVNRDLSKQPRWVTYLLNQPVIIGGEECDEINVKHYCFDSSLAPARKSVLIVMLRTS
jgi:phytoene dehydrogenase-like protein